MARCLYMYGHGYALPWRKKLVVKTIQARNSVVKAPTPVARPSIGAGVGAEAMGIDLARPIPLMPGLGRERGRLRERMLE